MMSSADTVKGHSLSEQTAERIVQYILDNGLCEGEKLPSEPELMRMLSVSRSTLREAVKALISRNILTIRRGAGTYVAEHMGMASDPLGLTFMQDKRKLALDLLAIRLMIEPEIAMLAAQNAKPADVAALEARCLAVEAAFEAKRPLIAADQAFHIGIAECSGNTVVAKLIPIIHSSIALQIGLTHNRLAGQSIVSHRQILTAIRFHNAVLARDEMYLHILYNKRSLFQGAP